MPDTGADTPSDALLEEAARFRALLAAGRSAVFLQLFDFLVARSGDGRAPKEVEIALAVFGRDGAEGNAGDSAVRVYVHRLRKRLDDHYAGRAGPRLHIPKGEYRILLSPADALVAPEASGPFGPLRWSARTWALAGAAILMLANLALWLSVTTGRAGSDPALQLRSTSFWHPVALDRAALLVSGDSFLLAEAEGQKSVKRLILDPQIQSRADLGSYLTTHPEAFYTLYDLDLHYAPVGTALATWQILPVMKALHRARGQDAALLPSSRLRPAALDSNDIVYVGRLSSLGILASPLFQTSGYRWDGAREILTDAASGKRYGAPGAIGTEPGLRRDYGYIASFRAPSGHHVLIIAGIGDKGVESMAQLVTNPAQIGALAGQRAATRSFEALYEVETMDGVTLDRKLILVRPLHRAATSLSAPAPAR